MDHRLALITGSTGFIGSRLAGRLVSEDWQVRLTRRARSSLHRLEGLDSQIVSLDLSEPSADQLSGALRGVTHVFHVAGRVSGTADELDTVNRLGTDILMRAVAEMSAPPAFLLVSSAAAGGPSDGRKARRPDETPQPISLYGASKLAGERAAIAARQVAPLTIVRPGIVFGPGDTEFIRILRAITRTRINPMIAGGRQPLSMIHVDDLVDLIIAAATEGHRVDEATADGDAARGEGVYHAADPIPMSLREIGSVVRRELPGRRFMDLSLPPAAGFGVGWVAEMSARAVGRTSTLNRDKIREARAPGWAIDVSKSESELDWSPALPLDRRLADLLHAGLQAGEL